MFNKISLPKVPLTPSLSSLYLGFTPPHRHLEGTTRTLSEGPLAGARRKRHHATVTCPQMIWLPKVFVHSFANQGLSSEAPSTRFVCPPDISRLT